jgi:hypothetical protein
LQPLATDEKDRENYLLRNIHNLYLSPNIVTVIKSRVINGNMWYALAIPVIGRGGPLGCETSRLPHVLENRLKYGGEVVSQEDSWYSFLLEAESTPGP